MSVDVRPQTVLSSERVRGTPARTSPPGEFAADARRTSPVAQSGGVAAGTALPGTVNPSCAPA